MIRSRITPALAARLRDFGRETSGGVIVEFGIVIVIFFLLFWVALDFGRMAYGRVLAQKAAEIAARTAVVRPPACAGVPARNVRGTVPNGKIPPRFGTSCSAGANVCAAAATVTCSGVATNATSAEIWTRISPMLPAGSAIGVLRFTYTFDQNLGFLGGPYTPMVTVDLDLPNFQFVSPIAPVMAGINASVARGLLRVSLPAEDLASGEAG